MCGGLGRPAVLRAAAGSRSPVCFELLTMISAKPRQAHRVAHRCASGRVRMDRRSLARLPNVGGRSTTTGLVGTKGGALPRGPRTAVCGCHVRTRGQRDLLGELFGRARLLAETFGVSTARAGRGELGSPTIAVLQLITVGSYITWVSHNGGGLGWVCYWCSGLRLASFAYLILRNSERCSKSLFHSRG